MYITAVEKGFTNPALYSVRPGPVPKFPLRDMKPGDSFKIIGGPQDAKALRNAAQNARRRYGMAFTVRKVGQGQWRCWRIDGAPPAEAGTDTAETSEY